MKMKKKTNMFSMNALIIPSELRFAQSQYQIMKATRVNINRLATAKRFTGGVSSIYFSILEGTSSLFMPINIGVSMG